MSNEFNSFFDVVQNKKYSQDAAGLEEKKRDGEHLDRLLNDEMYARIIVFTLLGLLMSCLTGWACFIMSNSWNIAFICSGIIFLLSVVITYVSRHEIY